MSSVYSEVTATYSRDRVLEKFDTAKNTLPYTIDDIKISHNDYLVSNVYNDAIDKLYKNWLYLIANAEIFTKTSPTTALTGDGARYIQFDNSLITENLTGNGYNPSGTTTLSSTNEIHIIKSPNEEKDLVFLYGNKNSLVFKINTDFTAGSTTLLLSGNEAEFNKNFKFDNIVSVDNYRDFLFVLDQGSSTLYKYDISGLLYKDPAIERTGIDDNTHPGRYLVKTVGGKGKTNRKNKLASPTSIKIYNKEVYVLDNGNFSIKVYDTNFNFIRDIADKELFITNDGNTPVSVTVDRESDISSTGKVFVLSKHGTITTYSVDFKNKQVYNPFGKFSNEFDLNYAEQKNFKKIVSSKSNNNILYVITNKQIIKFYKTNLNRPISFFDIPISTLSDERINSLGVESVSGVDNLLLQTSLSSGPTKFSLYKDSTDNKKLYHENLYTNFYTLSDIEVKPQEIVNAITFNKTTEKLIYNHSSLFENLNKKVYGRYSNTKTALISAVVESTFDLPDIFSITDDFYIGLNEPLLTDIINRPLTKLYNQQESLFDLIKESYLNNYPPVNVSEFVESTVDISNFQLIKFNTSNVTVSGGENIVYEIIRNTTIGTASASFYHSVGNNFSTDDLNGGFVPESDPENIFFHTGVSSISATFFTDSTFYSGPDKTFDILLLNPSEGAVIDSNNYIRTTTIRPTSADYTISLSATNPTTLTETQLSTFSVIRTNTYNSFNHEISANIFTTNLGHTSDSDYQKISTDNTYKGSVTDFVGTAPAQVSALDIHSQGTIIFPFGVSAIFFDISAAGGSGFEFGEQFKLQIKNPSNGATLGADTSQTITITEKVEPLSITVDTSFSTRHANTYYLSGVNVWDLLSGDSTFQDVSNFAVSANLTLADNLTVYSPTTARGAIYFDAGTITAPLLQGSTLKITIPSSTYLVGKGGAGGTGLKWNPGGGNGTDLTDVATITVLGIDDIDGKPGGPVITLSSFTYVEIENAGTIYGGSGGGGAGVLPITAMDMSPIWPDINASSGGGGGAGIAPNGNNNTGVGAGGSKYAGAGSFVNAGAAGTQTGPGAGGSINLPVPPATASNAFLVVSGAPGGNLGENGVGNDFPDEAKAIALPYTWTEDISALYAFRGVGGTRGRAVAGAEGGETLPSVAWTTRTSDVNTGGGTWCANT